MQKNTIGVDISKDKFDVHRLPDGAVRQFSNSKAGHRAFIKWVGLAADRIVFEPTGPYHRAFEGTCAKAGLPLCKVNPKQARRFAEALGTHAKTDAVDASLLARMGTALAIKSQPVAGEKLLQLRELRIAHQALIKERTRLKNRSQTLTVPLLKHQHDQRLKTVNTDIKAVLAAIMDLIQTDETMAKRFKILTSIPGVGKITAACLIIDMPELGKLDPGQAASLAGLAPMTRQSGQWRGKARIRGGRKHLRDALFMPAMVAMRFNDDLKTVYERLVSAGKPPKLAIAAIMRKLVILANALIKQNRKWTEKPA